ncbi:restriction endonuclease [Lentzea sp. NBRC 105346]|uniref:restriction endonuclease n=1 Tax=Lentzea sp. NBRC 105346 TaxID=3032205 RepID=UPI0025526D84|nr:restriction endonuclease [Lentzea sp. NBRC 105346]
MAEAAKLTASVQERVKAFESVLANGVRRRAHIGFDALRIDPSFPPFQPGQIAVAIRPPDWAYFAPPEPTGLMAKMFGGAKHQQLVQQRQADYHQACADHAAREQARQAALAQAEHRYHQRAQAHQAKAAQANAEVDRLEQGFTARLPEAIEDYFELVIESSPVPDDVPVDVEVAYQADARRLYVIRELPTVDIVPEAQEYKYIRTRDETDVKARPVKEIRQRYADLVAQLVLLTIRDVFDVHPRDLVNEVAVNAHVSTRNKATGQPERPCLVSVTATRENFEQLVLTELDASACLRHLNALVSPHPHDMEAVRPIFDPDLSKYRFIDEVDIASDLDGRQVLVDLTPTEFEHLVRQLFEAMGMKSWVTQASRDDGLDAIAVNEDPIMGGLCVVQAKRYRKLVPVESVRALAGTMDDKRASRGILVTTSWFGKSSHDFAKRNGRIQLIEGPELKHLLAEHLELDTVIGVQKGKVQPS